MPTDGRGRTCPPDTQAGPPGGPQLPLHGAGAPAVQPGPGALALLPPKQTRAVSALRSGEGEGGLSQGFLIGIFSKNSALKVL